MKSCNNCIHEIVCDAKLAVLDAAAAHFMRQQNGGMNNIKSINDGIKDVLGENCVFWRKTK